MLYKTNFSKEWPGYLKLEPSGGASDIKTVRFVLECKMVLKLYTSLFQQKSLSIKNKFSKSKNVANTDCLYRQ